MAKVNVIREIFSGENGKLSSKRVIGGIAMAIALICTVILVFRDGSNQIVENLLQTVFIISTALLGVSNITGIWKNSQINVGNNQTQIDISPEPEPIETIEQDEVLQNCDNCEYKLKCMEIEKGTE